MAHTESLFGKLTDFSAIIMKGSPNSSDRDAGFCSGSEAGDDLSIDNSRLEPCSPTNTSEDSIEAKVPPTSGRNKRKSTEPSKVVCREQETGPLKKRIRYNTSSSSESSFRPWDEVKQLQLQQQQQHQQQKQIHQQHVNHRLHHEIPMPNPAEIFLRHPGVTTLHLSSIKREEDYIQDEPLALVAKKSVVKVEMQSPQKSTSHDDDMSNDFTTSPTSNSSKRPPQRNYKNMTRERRIEANARERTRVHTISAAYETLRKSIPAYSNTQKLSKLSVLRVACSYILTLSRMAGEDYSQDQSEPSIAECTDSITKTIQTEGKIRKKKDD